MGFNDSALTAFDFFAGGGGASLGLHRAGINMLAALNHSLVAIETHEANFPGARHLLCDIRTQRSWGLGHADIMWASPDCTHHSIAKGGQSRDAKERALAEELPRFAYNLNVNCIMVENVKEFIQWGRTVEKNGKMVPDPKHKGEYYRQWVSTLYALGFVNYEHRIIDSADYGVPQSRKRYFGIFTRRGVPIVWPMPSHDRDGAHGLPKWRGVREVLDLSDRGRSLFNWGKPIADKSVRRVLAGVRKHVIGKGRTAPWLAKNTSNPPSGKPNAGPSVNEPSPTIACGWHPQLVTPVFIANPAWGGGSRHVDQPSPVIVARQDKGPMSLVSAQFLCGQYGRHHNTAACQPCPPVLCTPKHNLVTAQFLTHYYSGGGQQASLSKPCAAVTTNPHARLITPVFLAHYNGGSDNCRVLPLDGPANTVTTENRFGLVQMCLYQNNGVREHDDAARLTRPLAAPAPTLTTNGGNLFLMTYYGKGGTYPLCRPCTTLTTKDRVALCETEGFVTGSHGCNPPYSLDAPAKTIVASRRHQYLVQVYHDCPQLQPQPGDSVVMRLLKAVCRKYGIADIFMRMLKVSELKLIMGFPADYFLGGSATKQKEMLGNAVVPQVSEAIARAMTPSLTAARLRKLPKLRVQAINRYEQGEVFEREVTA